MPVADLDTTYVETLIRRLRGLSPDTKPAWGVMTGADLLPHLNHAVRYSMGREPAAPFAGNWFTKTLVRPFALRGFFPIPKNIKVTLPDTRNSCEGDLETLHALLLEYLSLVETGEIEPNPHPIFGEIGVDGWANFHVLHFEHHCRQFGL